MNCAHCHRSANSAAAYAPRAVTWARCGGSASWFGAASLATGWSLTGGVSWRVAGWPLSYFRAGQRMRSEHLGQRFAPLELDRCRLSRGCWIERDLGLLRLQMHRLECRRICHGRIVANER